MYEPADESAHDGDQAWSPNSTYIVTVDRPATYIEGRSEPTLARLGFVTRVILDHCYIAGLAFGGTMLLGNY